jgi:uncharacterized protein (DUF2336 family)
MTAELAVLRDVDETIATASGERRSALLRHVTDLFIVGPDQYTDEEIAVFDDVFNRLAAEIEISARALLAVRLAPIPKAPPNIIRTLAFDDSCEVACPVLALSPRLDDAILIESAKQKSQEHLLAISRRRTLSEAVTDVLVERGDQHVIWCTAENRGAKFSERGFTRLVQRSDGDDKLAASVGARPDVPPHLFRKLLSKASEHVRTKLEAENPKAKREIRLVVSEVAHRIETETLGTDPPETSDSVEAPNGPISVDDERLRTLAQQGRGEEVVETLAQMCQLPARFMAQAMAQDRSETVLVLVRAIGLAWPTVKAILLMRLKRRPLPAGEIAQCLASFERLKRSTAREILAFYQAREQGGVHPTAQLRSISPTIEDV